MTNLSYIMLREANNKSKYKRYDMTLCQQAPMPCFFVLKIYKIVKYKRGRIPVIHHLVFQYFSRFFGSLFFSFFSIWSFEKVLD